MPFLLLNMFKYMFINIILLLISYVYTLLRSDDICIKKVECNGKAYCELSNCKGQLAYDCNRLECAKNAQLCDEYHEMTRYMDRKKNDKLVRAKTLELMRGVPFVTKELRKLVKIRHYIELCE